MMNTKNAHLCVIKSELIQPNNTWQARWITNDDHKAIADPCTNIVNNDKWCAQNLRPDAKDAICPLLKINK